MTILSPSGKTPWAGNPVCRILCTSASPKNTALICIFSDFPCGERIFTFVTISFNGYTVVMAVLRVLRRALRHPCAAWESDIRAEKRAAFALFPPGEELPGAQKGRFGAERGRAFPGFYQRSCGRAPWRQKSGARLLALGAILRVLCGSLCARSRRRQGGLPRRVVLFLAGRGISGRARQGRRLGVVVLSARGEVCGAPRGQKGLPVWPVLSLARL